MTYVVVQQGLEGPSLDQLRNAFQTVPGMVLYDAIAAARHSFGILARGLDLAGASAMKSSLVEHGFAAEVLDESALPTLPESRMLHRLDCAKEALLIYDPLDRVVQLDWKDILLIAAGNTRMAEFKDIQTERRVSHYGPYGTSYSTTVTDHTYTEENPDQLLLEIVVTGGALRYSINASKCPPTIFNCLGARRTRDVTANFKLLVRDILQHTPEATTNRGAESLRQDGAVPFHYSSRAAFNDELIWLLWKLTVERPQA